MNELDQLAVNNMVQALKYKQPVVPLPRPDPRGTTFNNRLPPQIMEYNAKLMMQPYGNGVVPASPLLKQEGYSPKADMQAIIDPYDIMSHPQPESYGGGKYKIYTNAQGKHQPPAQDMIAEYLRKNALQP